jgi:hypothetical protein
MFPTRICSALVLAAVLGAVDARTANAQPAKIDPEAHAIAVEAYVYLYPLITMDVTRRQATNIAPDKEMGRGPMNTFSNIRAFPPADFRAVVRPNFDTLYSSGWLDLATEPMIVSVPNTEGRYYLLPMLDMWTDVFASPGKRTTGTAAGNFGVTPPGWKGTLPTGVDEIKAPTPYVWIIGRTQTNGPKDYFAVNKIQDGYKITPLSQWGKKATPLPAVKVDPTIDMKAAPLDTVNGMKAAEYFKYGAELMKLHVPHITDEPIVARMKRIGLVVGESFDFDKLDPALQKAFDAAPAAGMKAMKDRYPTLARVENGWGMNTDTMGVYGTYYLKRAIIAMVGLGANLPEDAIYPINFADADGKALDGSKKYVLHFEKDELPPVNAFWSVTMYDADGFQSPNVLNRFAIGDRDPLKYGADGSLDLHFQNGSPGADKEANWLPAPKGPLGVTMRLYAPRDVALDGRWVPPAVRRVD